MESPSIPQREPQEEPGPGERGDQPPAETGADDVPPAEQGGGDELPLDRPPEGGSTGPTV